MVVLVAALLRLLSYNFSLPFVDHLDEPNKYLGAQEWRGLYDSGGYYVGYPPGYLVVDLISQYVTEGLGHPGLAASVQMLRLVSVAFDLLTIIVIASAVALAGSLFAGVLAALVWAFAPLVLENNVYALPDPINAFLAALAIWLAAHALVNPARRRWVIWSVLAGLAATLLKYPAVPALLPGGLAALIIAVRHRRQGSRYLLVQAVIVAGTMIWLFLIYGIPLGSVEREGATIRSSGLQNTLDPNRFFTNLYYTIFPLHVVLFAAAVLLGGIALLILRRRGQQIAPHLLIAGLCLPLLVAIPWVTAAYAVVSATYRMRDVLPATAAACVLFGLSLDLILRALPARWRVLGGAGLVAVLTMVLYAPQLRADLAIVRDRRLPDLRVDMRYWFDTNLAPGTVLVNRDNEKTFNPIWGGIPHRQWFDWWPTEDIMTRPVAEWRSDYGISYAVIPLDQWNSMQASDEGKAYLAEMLHLRDFTSPTPVRGPQMAVYRLWRMQHDTAIHFGDHIVLAGYDQSGDSAQAGDALDFTFYWNVPSTPEANYSLFMHLVSTDDDTPLAQADGAPVVEERPTLTWDDSGEMLISPPIRLTIPPDLAAGDYRVTIGLYDYLTGARLPIRDAGGQSLGDSYLLTRLRVTG